MFRIKLLLNYAKNAIGIGFFIYFTLTFISCSPTPITPEKPAKKVTFKLWMHSGQENERLTMESIISRFNSSQSHIKIEYEVIPDAEYPSRLKSALENDEWPDLVEFDGPYSYQYIWQHCLWPLDDYLTESLRNILIPSIIQQGSFQGNLYTLGMYDSCIGLFGSKSKLQAAGIPIPESPVEAWPLADFELFLKLLSKNDPDGKVLDLNLQKAGEWMTYAFTPILVSAGGDLINRADYQTADNYLNSNTSSGVLELIQRWIQKNRFIDLNEDGEAFTAGRVALSLASQSDYRRYRKAMGNDMVLIPLPDFGNGPRTAQGAWCWGISSTCSDPKTAFQFIRFLLQDRHILELVDNNYAVPATLSAISKSHLHQEGNPLHLFAAQLTGGMAVPRPQTPAYPVISQSFQDAFNQILHGTNVKKALNTAVLRIDDDIKSHNGYSFSAQKQ